MEEGGEFSRRADAMLRVHPDFWQAWYALEVTYASRSNTLQAGLV